MYALKKNTQGYYIAKLMTGEWVSALRVAMGLHIIDMHARIQDIKRADGVLNTRDITVDGVTHTEYTLARAPRVERWSEADRDAFNRNVLPHKVPAPNAPAWVPPEPFDKMRLAA
ncbi:MAG: hypothetical protein ACRDAM_16055 [Casimicrobium sp.]